MSDVPSVPENYDAVRAQIIELLQAARRVAARRINSLMTATYWEIGRRIVQYEQRGEARADYGQQLIEQLANDLSRQFGRGFGRANLWQMRAFHRAWPEPKILQTASGESLTVPFFHNVDVIASGISTLATPFPLPWPAYVRLLAVGDQALTPRHFTSRLRARIKGNEATSGVQT